jgi:hydroxypyruvate reductase
MSNPDRSPGWQTRALRALFDAAVAAADPMVVVPPHLPPRPPGRVVVLGAGKASARMAEAVEEAWGPVEGLVVTRYGHGRPTRGIEIAEASHPVPDAAGVAATRRMLEIARGLGEGDLALVLISGGGSALLCAPAEGLTLEDKQAVARALLASGAPIGDINGVRKQLSEVKGGRLAAAIHPARTLALMISDVPGDDPGDIASGPTVGTNGDAARARAVLERWKADVPETVAACLRRGDAPVRPDDPRLSRTENRIIAAPSQSLRAAGAVAEGLGLAPRPLGDALEGEARVLAAEHVALALEMQEAMAPADPPLVLLSGGECTVSGRGTGVGGPNAEFALAAALELRGRTGIHLIACDTDGVDGAAEIAGAMVDPGTLARAAAAALDPAARLAAHDSHGFFGACGGQVVTGPTLTNVNDFRAILVEAPGGAATNGGSAPT